MYQALLLALTHLLPGVEWEYWASAPDSQHRLVGTVWPVGLTPRRSGVGIEQEYLVTVAVWEETPEALRVRVFDLLDTLGEAFGDRACLPLPPGFSATVDKVQVGTPNTTSAGTYAGPLGVWSVLAFNLEIKG